MTRLYNFNTIRNFRDFGNYAAQDGRHVRPASLFRSAHLNTADNIELEVVAKLDIGLIVDLRYQPERKRQPNKIPEGQNPTIFEFEDMIEREALAVAPHEAFMQHDLHEAQDARNYMNASYSARPDDPGFQSIFSKTLKHMAATGDPILIHCAAGKDRTGTLAAIILSALGVDRETILEDYMLTMEAVDIEKYLGSYAKMISSHFGRDYDPDSLRPMFGVEPDFLHSSLNTIGDMDSYLTDSLQLTKKERSALLDFYTV